MNVVDLTQLIEKAPAGFADRVLIAIGLADRYVVRESPVGRVAVAHNPAGISACRVLDEQGGTAAFEQWFATRFGRPVVTDRTPPRWLVAAIDSLLMGRRPQQPPTFDLRSVSAFARDVLLATATIPRGEVRPYGWVSARIGKREAVRAVGSALGRNPVPLLIPCHRVVRSDGKIGDYTFGPDMKRALLQLEGVDPDDPAQLSSAGASSGD